MTAHSAGRRRAAAPIITAPVLTAPVITALVCLTIGFCLCLATALAPTSTPDQVPEPRHAPLALKLGLDLAVGAAATALLPRLLRDRATRRGPAVPCLIAAAAAVSSSAVPAFLVVLFVIAVRRDRRPLTAVLTLLAAGTAVEAAVRPDRSRIDVILVPALLTAWLLLGLYVGARRAERSAREAERAALLRERGSDHARVRAEERAAIARDMHETLSRRLALISLHSGALVLRRDLQPEQIRDSAGLIQDTSRQADEELQTLLTVLACDDEERRAPAGMGHVDEIVAHHRSGGADVHLDIAPGMRGLLSGLPSMTSMALGRVVGEGIANAVEHAPGAPVRVECAPRDGGWLVRVTNPLVAGRGLGLPGGYGLLGLDERLLVVGGRINAAERGGEFVLEAWAPCP